MTSTSLPSFPYHPDPVATGSIKASDATCRACGQKRGFIYTGPVTGDEDLDDSLCPWCIADGSAHQKFGAGFTDPDGVGGYGLWEDVPDAVREEIAGRTPGFSGWQQEKWFTHCGDAAVFLGCMGKEELQGLGPEATEAVRLESGYNEEQWPDYYNALDKNYGPTAYLFRCRHCAALGGYSDCA